MIKSKLKLKEVGETIMLIDSSKYPKKVMFKFTKYEANDILGII